MSGAFQRKCRFCNEEVSTTVVDLGVTPLCQTQISHEQIDDMEPFYPLHALVCEHCWLVQLGDYVSPDSIFSEYAYFSSYSTSWLAHAKAYCEAVATRFELGAENFVVELASNDGYLLRNFNDLGIPCLGVEPAANVAEAAREIGVDTLNRFFGTDTAAHVAGERQTADLIIGNNVLAHVPDLNDFVAGIKILLAPEGVVTMEFPHLQKLMELNQFDTIYHEHFSYFSMLTVKEVFRKHGLRIFDVDEIPTHGGSLRIYAAHIDGSHKDSGAVNALVSREELAGFKDVTTYTRFHESVRTIKHDLLAFLIEEKRRGKQIVGYGAPGKGNTLLNYCGIGTDILDYTVDRNPYKQDTLTPGSRIPIFAPERIDETRPDWILILPWNLRDEIVASMAHVKDWGGKFLVPIPGLEVIEN